MNQKPKKRILTIDGGGLRGIFSAAVIEQMEEQAGRPAHDIFDCIVGTSAGSMLAAGLALGMPAAQLRGAFLKMGGAAFGNDEAAEEESTKESRSEGLKSALQEIFKDHKPCDALTRLVIPARNMHLGKTLFFGNLPNGQVFDGEFKPDPDVDPDECLWEIVLRSTALPPIFAPSGDYLDGGVSPYANPSYGAYVGVWKWFGWDAREYDLQFHSVGTGYFPARVNDLAERDDESLYRLMVHTYIQDVSLLQHMIMKKRRSDQLIGYKRYNVSYSPAGFKKMGLEDPEEGYAKLASTKEPPMEILAAIGTKLGRIKVDPMDFQA